MFRCVVDRLKHHDPGLDGIPICCLKLPPCLRVLVISYKGKESFAAEGPDSAKSVKEGLIFRLSPTGRVSNER